MDVAFAAPLVAAPVLIGAGVGAFASADIIRDEGDEPGPKPGKVIRGAAVGALWGASAGYFLMRAIPQASLEAALVQLRWPAAVTGAAIACFGLLALLARRSRPGRVLSHLVGAALAAVIVFATLFVLPSLSFSSDNPTPVQLQEAEGRRIVFFCMGTFGGAFVVFLLLSKLVTREFSSTMLSIVAAVGVGALVTAFFQAGARVSVQIVQEAVGAAGGASIFSFLGLLAGSALAAGIGLVFLVVAILFPGIEAGADLKDPASEFEDLSPPNPGIRAARAMGGFARLTKDAGALPVIMMFCGIFGFVGTMLGLIVGPFFATYVWTTLAG